jgi:FkbM family methyltransferase
MKLRVIKGASAEAFHVEEVDDESEAGDVEAVSISSIVSRYSFDEIDILKMDIEGAGNEVFSSPDVESWIDRVKVLIFECPDSDQYSRPKRRPMIQVVSS